MRTLASVSALAFLAAIVADLWLGRIEHRAEAPVPVPAAPVPAPESPQPTPPAPAARAYQPAEAEEPQRPEPPRSQALEKAARRIVHAIAEGDVDRVAKAASVAEIEVVHRRWASENTGDNYKDPCAERASDPEYLNMDGLTPLVSEDVQVGFRGRDLRSSEFRRLLRAFGNYIATTPNDFGPYYSVDTVDNWGARHLGPAAGGRYCAGSYWYVCFTRENGKWRVHRLEEAWH